MKIPQTRPIIAVLTLLFCFFMIREILRLPPNHDKTIAVQILSALTTLLGMVLAYYFGATHKSSSTTTTDTPKPNIKKMKQVFWNVDLEKFVNAVDDVTLANSVIAKDMPAVDANFEIGTDDTDQPVLMVTTSAPEVKLSFVDSTQSISVQADFIGSKPRRPR